jgi:hypothetical protein
MVTETAPRPLQESILAALIFNDRAGAAIAAQVIPAYFDDSYRNIAERVLTYRRKYGKAPGAAHLDDLFDKHLFDQKSHTRQLVMDLAGLARGINADYVLSRTNQFVREQNIKAALVASNMRWEQGGDDLAPSVEDILYKALRFKAETFDAGARLNDTKRVLKFLDRNTAEGIPFGIPELDRFGIALRPTEMTLYVGGKGTGKSWACVHVGKQAIKLGDKTVLHLSCEMSEELTIERYIQSLFSAATDPDSFEQSIFRFTRTGQLEKIEIHKTKPQYHFHDPEIRQVIRGLIQPFGARLGNVIIKRFPSGMLTISELEGYLDFLDYEFKFQPDLLILDYPDLMAQDSKNYRITMGRTFVDLRGLLVARHMAGFFPTQSNRIGMKASKVTTDMISEDISKAFTADNVLTYSRTEEEKKRNLARLYVSHARGKRDGQTIVISQSYTTGQYVLQGGSMLQTEAYWDVIKSNPNEDET